MTACMYCKQESPAGHYERVVENRTPLYGPWAGWRMAGRDLVSPDKDRISPERLRGLLFRQAAEARLAKYRQAESNAQLKTCRSVEILPARELFRGRA